MIYIEDSTYKFFKLKATLKDRTLYIRDKEDFESRLLLELTYTEESKAKLEDRKPEKVVLPEITYEEITHTPEEIARLKECQGCSANIQEVVQYVQTGKLPSTDHSLKFLEIRKLKEENLLLKLSNAQMLEEMQKSKLNLSLTIAQLVESIQK